MGVLKTEDQEIEYVLEKKRIRNCYISIKDGIVKVKVPLKTSDKKIQELLEEKKDWIIKNVTKQQKNKKVYKYVDGEMFRVLGKEIPLKITFEKTKKTKIKIWLNKLVVVLPIEFKENSNKQVEQLVDEFYTQLAEKEVEKAMRKMSMTVGLAPNLYRVKKLKSVWGNCSSKANISISRNIVMYSRHAIEYVCLHELCHLKYMNHSKDFWNMVEKYMPDYKKAEKELKS